MGGFQDAGLWAKCSFMLLSIGIVVWLASGYSYANDGSGTFYATAICMLVGLICYYAAELLAYLYIFIDDTAKNKIVLIIALIVSFIACVCGFVAALIIRSNQYSDRLCWSALCALLAGIFFILELVGVGGGGK